MSPLSVEIYNPEARNWVKAGEVKPGDPPGSISDNKTDGSRDIYMFDCAPDNSKSTIYRSSFGADVDLGTVRVVTSDPSRLETIKELKTGESFEMEVKTDRSPESRRIRFVHK
ncbi:MAG TPA: hypothetical protein VIK81_04665 [Patescibacteria group bacterium]